MASQVAHIIYAKKYFDSLEFGTGEEKIVENRQESNPPKDLDRDFFLLGCVFPDIRRIDAGIRRRDTHLRFDKIDLDFSGLSSFEAGWKFHLYCDMRREEILNRYDFYSLDRADEMYSQPAKLFEDELVYDGYNNWEKVVSYFRNPPAVETGINISRETFALWYAILAKYFETKPTDKTTRIFLSKLQKINGDTEKIMEIVTELRQNKKAAEIMIKVQEEIIF